MKTKKRGISLIVLVITIIVMIILASAIILTLTHSDVMDKAESARGQSDIATAKDLVSLASSEWITMTKEQKREKGPTFSDYAEKKLEDARIEKGTFEITDDGEIYAYPIIPEGFVMSPYGGEQTISDGMVIYKTDVSTISKYTQEDAQKTFDQFVWVPVDNMDNFKRTMWSNNAPTNEINEKYTEPSSYNASTAYQYSTEVLEYNAMKKSVGKHGGFYIARYEAGDGKATSNRTTTGTSVVVIRKGTFVYNFVGWGKGMTDVTNDVVDRTTNDGKGAVYLSQNIYPVNNNYTTHLIYGVQWDATLRWLSDKYNVTDSRSWGNYRNSIGNAATNAGSEQTCGKNEAWKAKNIYDLAGNVIEWTMEAYSTFERVVRGGVYNNDGDIFPASIHDPMIPSITFANYGFRPALYLN